MTKYISHSTEETLAISKTFSEQLPANSVVCFFGDLGAGKTTFVKGMAKALIGDQINVSSPTFVYLNIYEGKQNIYHFDLYRLKGVDEFLSMGFDEYMHAGGICCIEWSERIESLLPPNCYFITLSHKDLNTRIISIEQGILS